MKELSDVDEVQILAVQETVTRTCSPELDMTLERAGVAKDVVDESLEDTVDTDSRSEFLGEIVNDPECIDTCRPESSLAVGSVEVNNIVAADD